MWLIWNSLEIPEFDSPTGLCFPQSGIKGRDRHIWLTKDNVDPATAGKCTSWSSIYHIWTTFGTSICCAEWLKNTAGVAVKGLMKIIFQHKSEQKDSVWWRSPLCPRLCFMTVPVSCPYKSPSALKSSTSPADASILSKRGVISKYLDRFPQ